MVLQSQWSELENRNNWQKNYLAGLPLPSSSTWLKRTLNESQEISYQYNLQNLEGGSRLIWKFSKKSSFLVREASLTFWQSLKSVHFFANSPYSDRIKEDNRPDTKRGQEEESDGLPDLIYNEYLHICIYIIMLYNMWHHCIITSMTWSHRQLLDSRGCSHHTTRSPRLCFLVFKLKSVISAFVEHSLFAPNPPKIMHCMKYMIQRRTRPKLK